MDFAGIAPTGETVACATPLNPLATRERLPSVAQVPDRLEDSLATSDEWSRVGFTGNPVSGNPNVIESITKELRDLSDLAGRVSGGLDTLLTKAEDGGFEGKTANALRTYVKNELKTFMANINRSFDMAANATARYARALGDAQDRAENAADTVAALDRVDGKPLSDNDPEITRAHNDVNAEMDTIQAEAKILEDALHEAARLVSYPVRKPKKSFWKRFVSTFFKVLEIVALVITLIAAVIGGPLGVVAFGLGTVLFAKALVDYATGNGNALSLGLALIGILFPSTKGLTTISRLSRVASSSARILSGFLSASGRLLFRGGRMLFSSPGRFLSLTGQGLVKFGGGLGGRAASGFFVLPRMLSKTPSLLGSALRSMGGFTRNTLRQGWSALARDFHQSTKFIGGNMAGRLSFFAITSLGRLVTTALLPMRYSEIAQFGYRGAFRLGFIERGLHWSPRAIGPLGKTAPLAEDFTNLTGHNLDQGGTLRPFDGTNTEKLAVPGTPEFNDTLDELAEISLTPVTAPRSPDFGSLTGPGTLRMTDRLDDMSVGLNSRAPLETVGLPIGTVPNGQRLTFVNPVTGRVGDDLMPTQPRTPLTLFDQVDEFDRPLAPISLTTPLPPRDTVGQLRELDELTGMERTGAGLLKPLDDMGDLTKLSLDGRLGGLSEFQVRQIINGEIDLVNVTPDSVVLRVGKTNPVDVRVRLKDDVKIDVLGPADPRVPTMTSTAGTDRLDELGIKLDDLTRLLPDTGDGSRAARELLGLGPVRTDLTAPVTKSPAFTPLTLRDIVTGNATGKLATDRFHAWVRTQSTQLQLDTAGRELSDLTGQVDIPPLTRAQAELDLSAAQIGFNQARMAFDRLGMNLATVRRDIMVMMNRVDGPAGALPTGELRLLDDLGLPTGQRITMRPGPDITWALRTDAGIVPDVKVRLVDGVFTVTTPEGAVTRFGTDGRPTVLGDPGSVTLPRLSGVGADDVVLPTPRDMDRPAFAADRPIDIQTQWQRTPLENGGFTFTDRTGDIRLVFNADEVRQFTDVRLPIGDGFLRFDADTGPGSLPRIVGQDGVPLPGGATIEPVRGALGVVTGVRVRSLDGTWMARFDLDGTRLSEQLALSGPTGGPLTGSRLTTTFTPLPGGTQSATHRLTVPGLGDSAFDVVRLDGDLARRLPGGFSLTDTATGTRFAFDRGGRFVDLPVDGAPPLRLDVSGSATPDSTGGPPSTLNGRGDIGTSGDLGDLGRLGDLGGVGDLGRLNDLGHLGDLGEAGSLNRLALPDLPRTDLAPQPAGFDTRFASTVAEGAPTPVNPSRFDGITLSGADEVTNLRLQVTRLPATDLTSASFRIDVVDFGAPGGPVRLENVNVTLREGGALSISGPQGGVRWQFDALGRLQYRELPLSGTDLALRFTDDALNPMPRVVGPDGVPVQGATLTPVRDATGTLTELTVRVPTPGTDRLTSMWRFEPGGTLRGQELPLTLPGLDGPAGLGVKVTITPGTGGTTTRIIELTGPAHLTGSFRLGPMDGSLAGRLSNGFTVTDTVTGARFHFDADARLVVRDVPARDGSGFLRFTEDAAPGTPPVRLDELGDLGDFGGDLGTTAWIFDRTLDEASAFRAVPDMVDPSDLTGVRALDFQAGDLPSPRMDGLTDVTRLGPDGQSVPLDDLNRLIGPDGQLPPLEDLGRLLRPDGEPLPLDELNRLLDGPDSPRVDSGLSNLGEMSDVDLTTLQARLDNIRQDLDPPTHVPLSGVDDLSGFDLRLTRMPVSETTPPDTFRLELVGRAGGDVGPVRASDFTVDVLEDSGRYVVTDPSGTTRFTFAQDGTFLARESTLAFDGLPQGMRLQVTVTPLGDGTKRLAVDVTGPPGTTGSLRFTGVNSSLSARLPGGFTLTDTVTGSRFHFDHTGRLAFRDLPDPEGSGFLRFTEDAAPGTAPVRLDELGDFGGDLGERFGLDSIPEEAVPDSHALGTIDLAHVFDRTLDEASSLRTAPEGTPANMSDLTGAMDFLHVTPDSDAFLTLDLPGVRRLADDATASLDRFGLRPELLGDQLREMTTQGRLVLRRQAGTALGDYLDLPPATRLEDLRSSTPTGRVLGDFTITPTPHGGPGGSRYVVHHNPSDVTLGYDANRGLVYQEVFLRGGPSDLDGLKLGVTGRSPDGGRWTSTSVDFAGTRPADDLFTVAPSTDAPGGFALTDAAGTTHWHYGPDGVHAFRDTHLSGDRGTFRFDAGSPTGAPRVLDSTGRQLPGFRTEFLDDGRIALIPTGKGAQPLERTVFDPAGTLLEETVAIRGRHGVPTGNSWKIDHTSGKAVRLDASHSPLSGRFDTATVQKSDTGQFKLTGTEPGKVTLFERETLKNGHVVHIAQDRFGLARWSEFDASGDLSRHGRRIWDADQRTVHDVPSGSWRRLIDNAGDVRTYSKGTDGGVVRAEKSADGRWTWQRFDKDGAETLSGTRQWSWDNVGFEDTFVDPATGLETVAQRRGRTWPFGGEHGSRMYQQYSVVPGHAPAGGRVDSRAYTGTSSNAQIESLETLADGGSLLVKRYADMRPPAFLWKSAAGRSPFDGFFRDLFAGDSLHRVSFWTETAADGTKLTGVRLNPGGANWVDIDRYGRIVRETRKLDGGDTIEIGRSLDDPGRWAPAPEYRKGGSYELSWRDTTSGTTGTRHVDGNGRWRDLFTDDTGVERVRLRSEGRDTREYLFEAPSTRDLAADDNAGLWVDKNSLLHVTGRRDLIDGRIVESSGSPYRTSWQWKAYAPDDPATVVAEGVRKQNRGSFYSRTWDDSFVDLDGLGNRIRERNATDTAGSWVDAVKQADSTWKWTKTSADGTVHSTGTRVYDDIADGGRWRDLVDGQVVRERVAGGRVREFDYKILTPEPPTAPPTSGSLRDLLAHSARQFEPPRTVEVNARVWKEYDLGKAFRERVAVDGVPGRFREVDKPWGQWREFQDGHLVEQRTFTGRVWKTDAFGRFRTSGPAMIPENLAGALPRMGDEVGLPGDTGWRLIGRETDFRGREIEALGLLREVQDPWHGVFQGVKDGVSVEMPVWQRELRSTLTSFALGFVTDFATSLMITELTNTGNIKPLDVYKALLSGSVGGTFSGGLNVLYNRTRLGYFKNSLGARDWGSHPKQSMAGNTDDWATDWAAQEKPTRWRSATYANTMGIATSALSGFVSNAISASVFGVNGNEVKGMDALLAGLWGAGAFAFSGVTTGLARNAFHLTTGARVFHRGGLSELGINFGESALARYFNWLIAEEDKKNGNNLPSPGRAFPAPPKTTTPTTPPSPTVPAPQRQPASNPAALLFDGLEYP